MDVRHRGSVHHCLWAAFILVALLLPSSQLVADEGEKHGSNEHEGEESISTLEHEPITLRGQRIPSYAVFETFLLHASFIYDMRGPDAYRDFLTDYGLNPDLRALQELPRAFDELETSRKNRSELQQAMRLGEVFGEVLTAIATDPNAIDETTFRFELLRQLQPKMSWIFLDVHPDFAIIDQSEEDFREAIRGSRTYPQVGSVKPNGDGAEHETESPAGAQVKISHLGEWQKTGQVGSNARFEWRRYASEDGSVRVIGLIDTGTEPLFLVDMSFPTDEHLRSEFKHGGVDGVLRFAEDFRIELGSQEKSHTTLGCFAAEGAAVLACATCVVDPTHLSCGACAVALAAAAAACNQPHCNQIQCNAGCVQACHLYGICSSTSGSSSPADCSCVGRRYDIPGCELPFPCNDSLADPFSKVGFDGGADPIICNPCSSTVTEVDMLRLDGSGPVRLPSGVVTLSRLEPSDAMHGGDPVSYLMEEWAVVDFGAPGTATKSASSARTLRSSLPEFGASLAQTLNGSLPGATGGSAGLAGRLAIMVATPPHEANSREIPMPALEIRSDGVPAGVGRGQVAIRADFSEAGVLQGFEVLADTMGGISPQLADHLEQALSLQRRSEKEHRVVAFVVLSVGESLRIESSLAYLPKCCCGGEFCI
jgi:hypothetical protein